MRYRWNPVSPPTNQRAIKQYIKSPKEAGECLKAFHTVGSPSSMRNLMYKADIANT
jgi:hypothetical protein